LNEADFHKKKFLGNRVENSGGQSSNHNNNFSIFAFSASFNFDSLDRSGKRKLFLSKLQRVSLSQSCPLRVDVA
jgi:hypothetical protein